MRLSKTGVRYAKRYVKRCSSQCLSSAGQTS